MGELVESWQAFPRSTVSWFMWRLIDWYWSSVQSIVICHEISFLKGNNSHNLFDWIRLVSSQGKTFNFLVAIKIKKKRKKEKQDGNPQLLLSYFYFVDTQTSDGRLSLKEFQMFAVETIVQIGVFICGNLLHLTS